MRWIKLRRAITHTPSHSRNDASLRLCVVARALGVGLHFKKSARYLVRMLLRTRGRRPASSSLPSIPCRATPERSGLVYQRETSLEGRQAFTAGPDDE